MIICILTILVLWLDYHLFLWVLIDFRPKWWPGRGIYLYFRTWRKPSGMPWVCFLFGHKWEHAVCVHCKDSSLGIILDHTDSGKLRVDWLIASLWKKARGLRCSDCGKWFGRHGDCVPF